MCGICGTYEYGTERPPDRRVLAGMLELIRHRGPDDEGVFIDRNLAMGMRRLSIIDLAGGRQPMTNEDGSVVVVFNGEIYNYVQLREELSARGHHFSTISDTEVIAHLYEEQDEDCIQSLRGMFALSVWDRPRQRLFLARDRLGIKPLYYTESQGALVFGSEIKAILEHPCVEAALDPEALSNYLSLRYVPAPQTMFAGIRALQPGHSLTCDAKGVRIREYWRLSFARDPDVSISDEEYEEQLEALLRESVKLHLVSDVPFGAFLSGGVDSSTIVALMSQILPKPVRTFSVGFAGEGSAFSELPYARIVAERFHTDHHEVLIRCADLVNLAEKVLWHLDQPIADNACIANYMVSELAARHVKMVLTGEGGDELFAGYARYSGERFSSWFQRAPRPALALARALIGRLHGLRRPKLALFALCQTDEAVRLSNWFPMFNDEMKSQLLAGGFRQSLGNISSGSVFGWHLSRTDAIETLNRMLYVDTKLWLPDDLLARGDKTSMAASLEARVPLLDHKLVEFAAALPPHLKLRGMTRKYLLKKIARRWLPDEIIDRKKEGFPMPFAVWFRKDARPFVRDLLSPSVVRRRGYFSADYVEKLLDEHESGAADHGGLLWGLLSLELWHRAWLDTTRRQYRNGGELCSVETS